MRHKPNIGLIAILLLCIAAWILIINGIVALVGILKQ